MVANDVQLGRALGRHTATEAGARRVAVIDLLGRDHKLAGGAMADGQVFCAEAGGVDAAGKAALDNFRAAYKKRFGIDVQINAPYACDAVMTMAAAMAKAGSAAPAKYLPALAGIEHKGVTGLVAFDAKGDVRDGTITLYTFKGGRRTVLAVTK